MAQTARTKGFTLVELLIVVAIIGILTAIAVPRLLYALQAARQKRTVADMRVISEAVEIYQQDNAFYPKVVSGTMGDLHDMLVPYSIGNLVLQDGWRQPIYYRGETAGTEYTIISYGSNFAPDYASGTEYLYGPTSRFRDDIVISGAVFIQWPDGAQTD